MSKRFLDLVLSVIGLVVASPVLVAIGVVVWSHDRGPVFYRQVRVGFRGQQFRIWKFRTMRVGADREGPAVTKRGDGRVTTVGRFLRRSKLDELPQLFNVLKGEMSFVGPRPEVPHYVELYSLEQRRVLELKPGITDLASLRFRNEEEELARSENYEQFYIEFCIPQKIRLNVDYASKATVLSDAKLIFDTMFILVGGGDIVRYCSSFRDFVVRGRRCVSAFLKD